MEKYYYALIIDRINNNYYFEYYIKINSDNNCIDINYNEIYNIKHMIVNNLEKNEYLKEKYYYIDIVEIDKIQFNLKNIDTYNIIENDNITFLRRKL